MAITSGSSWNVVALTIASARWAGLPDLKMPEPTNTPSAPSCIIIAASAGVAMPPAVNSTTGSLPGRGDLLDQVVRRLQLLGRDEQLGLVEGAAGGGCSARIVRMCRVASTTSPVPASPLERIIAAPSVIRRSASPRSVAPQTNGTVNAALVDVVRVVGRGEHLGLVDVVDAEGLQHLRLDEVADARLGHHRDGDGLDDAVDHVGVAHAGDAALGADVGGHPLEGHDGDGAGVLGDLRLLGGDDVHDDAALELSAMPRLTRAVPVPAGVVGLVRCHGIAASGRGAVGRLHRTAAQRPGLRRAVRRRRGRGRGPVVDVEEPRAAAGTAAAATSADSRARRSAWVSRTASL